MIYNLELIVPDMYRPSEVHFIGNNGCCEKNYFVLTTNLFDGRVNYSCQCGCGGWCTNGHQRAEDAINEYFDMCNRYEKENKKKGE